MNTVHSESFFWLECVSYTLQIKLEMVGFYTFFYLIFFGPNFTISFSKKYIKIVLTCYVFISYNFFFHVSLKNAIYINLYFLVYIHKYIQYNICLNSPNSANRLSYSLINVIHWRKICPSIYKDIKYNQVILALKFVHSIRATEIPKIFTFTIIKK
jgi:hypothetical protein